MRRLLLTAPVLLMSFTFSCDSSEEDLSLQQACTISVDGTRDEASDGNIDENFTNTLSPDGLLIRTDQINTDDTGARHTIYTYNLKLQLISEENFIAQFTSPNSTRTYEYDEEGRLVREQVGGDIDTASFDEQTTYGEFGIVEQVTLNFNSETKETRSYNERGVVAKARVVVDGEPSHTFEYNYDEDLNAIEVLRTSLRPDSYTALYRYTYNSGLVTSYTIDQDADQTIDGKSTFEYDSAGNLLAERNDCDMDGIVDWENLFQYDDRGRVVWQSLNTGEHDGDDTIVTKFDYSCRG